MLCAPGTTVVVPATVSPSVSPPVPLKTTYRPSSDTQCGGAIEGVVPSPATIVVMPVSADAPETARTAAAVIRRPPRRTRVPHVNSPDPRKNPCRMNVLPSHTVPLTAVAPRQNPLCTLPLQHCPLRVKG